MNQNKELIEKFYTAFQRLDAEAMISCYHPDIRFSDPVFPSLSASEVGAMWRSRISPRLDTSASQKSSKAGFLVRPTGISFSVRLFKQVGILHLLRQIPINVRMPKIFTRLNNRQ